MSETVPNTLSRLPPAVILSHRTAVAYYRVLNPKDRKAAHATRADPLPRASASSQLLKTFNPEFSGFGGLPLDLLVPDRRNVRMSKGINAHSCQVKLPEGSFWKLNDTLYITSPELCFVQMAQMMSIPQIVEVGLNLCAIYYADIKSSKLPERKPLTTPTKLARYAERANGMKGVKKAKQALRWVIACSRSPMETKMFILLSYPPSRGGYGLNLPVLNYRADPGRYAYLTEQGFFRIDICNPDLFVGVEYYGDDDHQDNVVKDRRRLDALEALGWKMVVIDKQRLYDPAAFEVAANQIASHLNCRIRKNSNWQKAHEALRKDLGLDASSADRAHAQVAQSAKPI